MITNFYKTFLIPNSRINIERHPKLGAFAGIPILGVRVGI